MTTKNEGELALQLMDTDALRAALQEIAYQSRNMADEQRTMNGVLELVVRAHVPAEQQQRVLGLLQNTAERETWLNQQLQVSAQVVASVLELARTFREQRDGEVRRRVRAEKELETLTEKLENGDTDDPLIEQFLNIVGEVWYDLE